MSNKSCIVLTAALLYSTLPAWSQELPDGPGKELAAANCNSCHTLLSRVGAGYTPEGWSTVMRMMANQGVAVPADQVAPLREYLTKNFPEKGKPAGMVIPGSAKVSFKAWQAPTPGSRPHDPLAARDGSLWYTG
jgi:virginiamycin B lyase